MTKAGQGIWLAAAGIALAIGAFILRAISVSSHEYDRDVAEMSDRFAGRAVGDYAFDNTPYLIAGAIAALLVLCGVILYATSERGNDHTQHHATGQGQGTDTP